MRRSDVPPRCAARDPFGRSRAWSALVLVLSSCARTSSSVAFDAPRAADRKADEIRWDATDDERLGGKRRASADDASTLPGLAWDLPKGWSELPPSSMRAASFRAGDVECWLTLLGGDGGGLAANANRWRTQLGAKEYTDAELASLERVPFLGGDGVLVDATGRYVGMGGMGGEAHDGWRLVGLLRVEAEGSAFLKMVGPAASVAAELDAFRSLARSFRAKSATSSASASNATAASAANVASGLAWKAPDGWRQAPARATRVVTYFVGPGDAECYVTTLAGDAGGALANVNRWRGQLGLPAIGAAEIANAPPIGMLGTRGVLVELESADHATRMLGALASTSARSAFVKLTGPAEQVRAARDAFVAFAGSITEASR